MVMGMSEDRNINEEYGFLDLGTAQTGRNLKKSSEEHFVVCYDSVFFSMFVKSYLLSFCCHTLTFECFHNFEIIVNYVLVKT